MRECSAPYFGPLWNGFLNFTGTESWVGNLGLNGLHLCRIPPPPENMKSSDFLLNVIRIFFIPSEHHNLEPEVNDGLIAKVFSSFSEYSLFHIKYACVIFTFLFQAIHWWQQSDWLSLPEKISVTKEWKNVSIFSQFFMEFKNINFFCRFIMYT